MLIVSGRADITAAIASLCERLQQLIAVHLQLVNTSRELDSPEATFVATRHVLAVSLLLSKVHVHNHFHVLFSLFGRADITSAMACICSFSNFIRELDIPEVLLLHNNGQVVSFLL